MARRKRNSGNGSEAIPERKVPEGVVVPEGYEARSTDIVGFWDPEKSPSLHFIPLEAKLFDSDLDASKPSTLIFGKLVDGCLLKTPKGDEDTEGEPGDLIGVWFKPGMAALKDLCGVKVFMYPTGEMETGKPNPMKTFDIHSRSKGTRIPVTDDKRDKSKHVTTLLSGPKVSGRHNAENPPDQGADDVDY